MTGTRENPMKPDQLTPFLLLWKDTEDGVPIERLRQIWAMGKYAGCPADLARDLVKG